MKYYILAGEMLVIITSLAIKWFHKYIHDYFAFTLATNLLVDLR